MLERTNNLPELFDQSKIVEVTDPDDPTRRYCLCRNPLTAEREGRTRSELVERSKKEFERIAATALKTQKQKNPASDEVIGARVGQVLAKTKMGKYITWKMQPGGILEWQVNEAKIAADKALDGCYVIKTTVSAEVMDKEQVVARYKSLSQVEQAFRNMKTVSLEIRPMYHKSDERIRAHVFICMLAYYLQWHMTERLEPLLAEQESQLEAGIIERKERRWTLSNIIEILKTQHRSTVKMAGMTFEQTNEPTPDQARLLALLSPATAVKHTATKPVK